MSNDVDTSFLHGYPTKICRVHTVLALSNLDISKDSESFLSLLFYWNSTTHTFFIRCQEVSPSLEYVYEIL